MMTHHVLILGGAGDARRLAMRLAAEPGFDVTLSLAGRTENPLLPEGARVRVGGFGGVEGLTRYLEGNGIDLLVDATHPFAARISANAAGAARMSDVPLLVLERVPWRAVAGDRWIEVADIPEAASSLGDAPVTVFLAIGRQELEPFAAFPQHAFVVRSVDAAELPEALSRARRIEARGPFETPDEIALLAAERIDIVVAKNSGGAATYGKIAAARTLGLPVVMVRRPDRSAGGETVGSVEEALGWLRHRAGFPLDRGE